MKKINEKELVREARKAMERSYSPYSGFSVGAALIDTEGRIYHGANIENASFTPTCCAERVAIFKAVSEGVKDFSAIAIVGSGGNFTAPCGVCRQVMREFCSDDFEIYLADKNDNIKKYTLAELFPESFGPDDL